MSQTSINHLSVNDEFWIKLDDKLISFGFKRLPDKVHFTVGFDERSPDINFHVTKNVADPKDKPQIKIAIANKELMKIIGPSMIYGVFKLLVPIDIKKLISSEAGYISFKDLQEDFWLTEEQLKKIFNARMRKKTQLKIEGDIEKSLREIATLDDTQEYLFNRIVEFPSKFHDNIEGGIILTNEKIIQGIRIGDEWFTLQMNKTPLEMLTIYLPENLAKHFIRKTKEALVAMKTANKYSDTEALNRPIRLTLQFPSIQTSRLNISPFSLSDWPFILELLNTPGWLQFIGDRNVHNEAQAKAYLTNGPIKSYADFGFGLMNVKSIATGQSIGMCGLLKRDTLQYPDIGFAFLPEVAGQGYAFEAANAILQSAQQKLKTQEIYAIVQPDNERSIALLKKLRFEFVKEFSFPDKTEVLALYSLHN